MSRVLMRKLQGWDAATKTFCCFSQRLISGVIPIALWHSSCCVKWTLKGEALAEVTQSSCGCPNPGKFWVPGQVGWGFGQTDLVCGIPARGGGIGLFAWFSWLCSQPPVPTRHWFRFGSATRNCQAWDAPVLQDLGQTQADFVLVWHTADLWLCETAKDEPSTFRPLSSTGIAIQRQVQFFINRYCDALSLLSLQHIKEVEGEICALSGCSTLFMAS